MLDGPGAGRDVRRHAAARGPERSIRYAGSTDDSEVVFDRPIKCCDGLHSISHCSPDASGELGQARRHIRLRARCRRNGRAQSTPGRRHAHARVDERREIEREEENAARESRVSHREPLK
ncbi:hypothetical protein C6T59_28505 [Burkholderia multivorans]|nr:hypothetical protein C6Q01_13810 [Burkholderia multivorans]PRF86952.1 hypothetical protein C6Q23_23100 [Burkholderia multivorans]PRG60221.1 hypothetical protein C6T59_28505 [Burkholderia multivorans]